MEIREKHKYCNFEGFGKFETLAYSEIDQEYDSNHPLGARTIEVTSQDTFDAKAFFFDFLGFSTAL